MDTDWLIALGLFALYILFVFWLLQSGRLAKWNLSLMLGIVLMVRTQRGRGFLNAVARPKRFWNAFGDLGTVVTLAGMLLIAVFFLFAAGIALTPGSGVESLSADEVLVIPGVNPFVPLWYGLIALIVTLVVHEGGHGILARANGMKVKSIGLLFLVVPIGAFVEPDELDLKASRRRHRLRVFAAGPALNLAVAFLALGGFAGAVAAAEPHEGVPVAGAFLGDPAYDAGLRAGDILVAANGQPLLDYDAFVGFMDNRNPGDEVTFELRSGETVEVTLSSRWDHYSDAEKERIQRDDPRLAEAYQQEAFLGISPFTHERASFLAHPFESTAGFLTLISLPLGEVRGAPYLSTYLPAFYDTPFDGDLYWPLATMVFWIFWINLMVGLTNVLPMMPLDGGHIFRDAMGGLFEKARPGMDASRRERLVGRTSTTVSLVILAAFLLQLFGPRLVGAFA